MPIGEQDQQVLDVLAFRRRYPPTDLDLQKIEHKVYPQVERLFTVDLDLAIRPSIPTQ